ncbi:metallophosphoesterase [Jeotgalibacillus sp. ET6]|uniref:metallophosphoesterase n=1 Tax=Jeotgalibacillus sp. ET6 TaxID=3037260 RepID=UPI002418A2BD|nr:metallophosphoesterase [Jeotgalibacillus sp. ET6]MDG5472625.1 metallophosphoesterase [Jeotgalibacillus sp. ET6]
MKKKTGCISFFILFIAGLAGFIYWDNNRITVVEQGVHVPEISSEFNQFRILQISDLHEKTFGKNQSRLIKKINAIEYDAILFTGDMMDDPEETNWTAFFELLEGIQNKEHAFYVPGNTDPESYILNDSGTIEKSLYINEMEKRGVLLLESINTIERGQESLHIVQFDTAVMNPDEDFEPLNGRVTRTIENEPAYIAYQNEQLKLFSRLEGQEQEAIIALSHYPIVDVQIDYLKDQKHFRDFSLILAGHYHGGQIRLPILGALFVPEAWYDNGGILPPSDRVSGLWEYEGTKQYVSTGLGSSDALSFLNFRLFNPPQLNLLTLHSEKSGDH